ncbi:MAG: hypothetical protein AAFY28_19385, partial [Actinomycetota bacterium]
PGFTFTATVSNCLPGEEVIFRFQGESQSTTCSTTTFQASATFEAPQQPGIYPVFADLTGRGSIVPISGMALGLIRPASPPEVDAERPLTLVLNVEVIADTTTTGPPTTPATTPSGGLPDTGASGIGGTGTIAAILVGVGALLLIVAQVRKRSAASAAG